MVCSWGRKGKGRRRKVCLSLSEYCRLSGKKLEAYSPFVLKPTPTLSPQPPAAPVATEAASRYQDRWTPHPSAETASGTQSSPGMPAPVTVLLRQMMVEEDLRKRWRRRLWSVPPRRRWLIFGAAGPIHPRNNLAPRLVSLCRPSAQTPTGGSGAFLWEKPGLIRGSGHPVYLSEDRCKKGGLR
jgi:hypothetical protein